MATKKFFTKEVKIGIVFVVAFAILYWGLNYLKGVNLMTPTNNYTLQYERIDGLVVSNDVTIKGYKVGQVHSIAYDFSSHTPFTVVIDINKDIKLPKGTIASLTDESLMGGKCIDLILGDIETNDYYKMGETLPSEIDGGLIGTLAEIVPTLSATVAHADSLVKSVNDIVNGENIQNSLGNIEDMTTELRHTTKSLNVVIDHKLPRIINQIDTAVGNISSISKQLEAIDYSDIILSVDSTLNNLNKFTQRINDPNGTLGLLLNDQELYRNVATTISSANNLLIDLKANPKRYVHFSLFGSKEKKADSSKNSK